MVEYFRTMVRSKTRMVNRRLRAAFRQKRRLGTDFHGLHPAISPESTCLTIQAFCRYYCFKHEALR